MKVYIRPETNYSQIVRYVLKIIEKNINHLFQFVDHSNDADTIWDHEHPNSEPIAIHFYDEIKKDSFDSNNYFFSSELSILTDDHKKDAIATIFYMVNCMQEFNASDDSFDNFGRFKYAASYQSKFNNIEKNLVQAEIDSLAAKWKINNSKTKSDFFISHDIDTIYGSFLQDGFWALKNMKIGVILNLLALEFTRKPHWKNIDRIIKINSEYELKSTFFWLVNKGLGHQNVKNADYNIKKEQALLKMVEEAKFINGLHKSSSLDSINEELDKTGLSDCTYNRYHFLKFKSHEDWLKISQSQLNFDCSLGFAEHYGFRNSYGKAFQPFDVRKEKPFDFIEAPLNFMDGTFHKYMKWPRNKVAEIIIDLYENNKYNCNFSLLWHNTYFSDYKYNSFLDEYKKVLGFIYENEIQCVTPKELIKNNALTW
jgi:hypothetical protein